MTELFPTPCAISGSADPVLCRVCEVRDHAFCSILDDHEIAQLDAIVTHVHLNHGDVLFYEGDEAEYAFTLTSGTLRLYKLLADGRRQITGFVYPGDFLGLSDSDEYSHTAEAVTEVGLCRLPRRRLQHLFDRYPKLERRLLEKARDELIAVQEQMLLLGRKAPAEKLATFLISLARRNDASGLPASPVLLPMSRSDIADYLGLTVETVSRTLTRLKAVGFIDLPEAHCVEIGDANGLEELAEGNGIDARV